MQTPRGNRDRGKKATRRGFSLDLICGPDGSRERWRVVRDDLSYASIWGLCDYPGRTITLHESMSGERLLEITAHEVAHAVNPKLSERDVEQIGRAVAKVLWRDGWRRSNPTE